MSDCLTDKMDTLDINRTGNGSNLTPANEGIVNIEKTSGNTIDVVVSPRRSRGANIGLQSSRRRTLSPIRVAHNRSLSPGRHFSRKRERSFTQSPERSFMVSKSPDRLRQRERSFTQSPERTFILSKSPDRSRIWSQWDLPDNKKDCLQDYNIRQMERLYGQPLGGQVEVALQWYRQKAITEATVPISFTPRGTQTERSASGVNDQAYKRFVGSPYKNTEMKAKEMLKSERNLNKLSTRHRVQRTPGVNEIRAREQQFTNDAIVTERRRTRFKDIIPQYDASADKHCKAYFKRRDVQDLLSVTRSRDNTPAGSVTPGQTPAGFTPRPTPGATPW